VNIALIWIRRRKGSFRSWILTIGTWRQIGRATENATDSGRELISVANVGLGHCACCITDWGHRWIKALRLWKQLEVFLPRATKLFRSTWRILNGIKKSVFWMQKAARKCDRDSTKKKPEKWETQMWKGGHSRATDRLLARGTKLCDQVGLCYRLWRSILTRFIRRRD